MGRKKASGARTAKGRLSRSKLALIERNPPSERIMALRATFDFVLPRKGPDGSVGTVDQLVCDGVGQLCAVGLLDGTPVDPFAMVLRAREYAEMWWNRNPELHPGTGKLEPYIKSTGGHQGLSSGAEDYFNKMDLALTGFARDCVIALCVDQAWGDEIVPWAHSLIAEALLRRGKIVRFMQFPTMDDRARLDAVKAGLMALVDGALPGRWSEAA